MTIMLSYLKLFILFIDFTNVYYLTPATYWTLCWALDVQKYPGPGAPIFVGWGTREIHEQLGIN